MKIYLDVCCLNRPFDDLSQIRVAIEAAAVGRVLDLVEALKFEDYSSEMVSVEVEQMPDPDGRRKVLALMPPKDRTIPLSDGLLDAADTLILLGFGLADAVHLCAAKTIGVDVFLTVDDKLLKRAKRFATKVGIRVTDPVSFLRELNNDDDR